MKIPYSANEQLKIFGQKLGFKVYLFDDPQFGPEIKLREESRNEEIDAFLFYKNIFCLVGIKKGKKDNLDKQVGEFFEKLDRVQEVSDLKLTLVITTRNKKKVESRKKRAERLLRKIESNLKRTSKEYKIILRKIFFAPNKQFEEVVRQRPDELIIDKDVFEYFQEVSSRLDKKFLFYDFMHFLGIKKTDLTKKEASRTTIPPKSSPFKVDRLEIEKGKIIMYSLSLRVEDIIEYVTVLRVARKYDKKGFQRMIKSGRLIKINKEYLNKNETFPNNIIIALNPELYKKEEDFYKDGQITFFDDFNSLIIIDGQHRFFSFVKGNKTNRHILVTLVFFKGRDENETYLLMEKMFYKINKTQERIDPNLSFFLVAKIDPKSEENFWYNVFGKLDKKGFFKNRFSFKEATMRRRDSKKSIISVITYGGVLRLNKTYKRKGVEANGLDVFYGRDREKCITFAFYLLKNYFDIIEAVLYQQRVDKEKLAPREIGALLRLIRHFIITNKKKVKILGEKEDIIKSEKKADKRVVSYFEKILQSIPFNEVINLEYPASNWAAVEGYMLKKIHKTNPDFGNKGLLSSKALDVYEREN